MAKYYQGNKTELVSDLIGEIESGLDQINEEVNTLESFDWNEIFEHVPNSDRVQDDIESAISSIRGVLDSFKR
jgi:hypothetical protein